MKRRKRFDNILNECLERLLRGETIEQCLQDYPEQAAELEPLLRTALAARRASTIQPRAEFKARARYQLQSALQEMESRRGRWFFVWQSRWATAVAAILIFLLVGGGTVAAAGNSMPDGTLYPVKLATEQVRLTLTPSALAKAQLYARLADNRVAEIVYMASKGDPQRVELVARRLDTHLVRIATLAASRGEEAPVMLAPVPAPERDDKDTRVLAPVPAAPVPALEPADEGVRPPAPERAGEAPGVASTQADRRAKLRMVIMRYAVNHPDRLRAILKTAPDSAKPALRRAIRAAVQGYERALESIEDGEDNRGLRERQNNGSIRDRESNRSLRDRE